MKQRMRVIVLGATVFALASCQSLPHLFDRSGNPTTVVADPDEVTAGTMPTTLIPNEVTAEVMSRPEEVDESRISTLKADNARLQRQLSGALRENAKLKKDLADLRDDNSLLKDLAVKKQR
jgi:hypothetical protein